MLPIGKKRLHKIIAADGDKCFYCGVKTYRHGNDRKDDSSTVDHVLPIKMGGIDHIDNCVNACHWYNNQKGSDRLVPINTFINFSLSQKTLKPASANVKTAK